MASNLTVPRKLPLLIVRENVLLPGSSMRIPVKSLNNVNLVKSRLFGRNSLSSTIVGVVPEEPDSQHDGDVEVYHKIGTAAAVVQVTGTNWPQPMFTILVTGLCRFKIEDMLQETPFPIAMVKQLDHVPSDELEENVPMDTDLSVLSDSFREQASKLVEMLDVSIPIVSKLKKMLHNLPSHNLPDICASIVKASVSERIQILDALDLHERFTKTLPLLMRQIEALKLLHKAKRNDFDLLRNKKDRRIHQFLNNKNRAISDDIDDIDGEDIHDLADRIRSADMPEYAKNTAKKELKRLKKMPQQMPEHAMLRNYLQLMVDLPWNRSSEDNLDIEKARSDLDEDHYGLEKLKRRVLEFLAVKQLKNSLKGPILCFVGPPGVGKTSVGRSVARTLGREFHRISLGGIYDQSDIRGHRRTYIGSMSGRIIQGLKTVGVNNPVFLLDEVDKLGRGLHGDPAAALLEVLDPEQNQSFTDQYPHMIFKLSETLNYLYVYKSMGRTQPYTIQ